MKTKNIYFLLFFSLLLLAGCMKSRVPIPEEYSDYIGLWRGEHGSEIVINADGSGSLYIEKQQGGSTSTKSADVANIEITGTEIIFNTIMGLKFTLPVTEPPHIHGDVFHMQVDGVWFDLVGK